MARVVPLASSIALTACSADPDGGSPACAAAPCLEVPAAGVQVRNQGITVSPAEDIEMCEVVRLPGSPDELYYVQRIESAMTSGSHHLIVATIDPGTETEANAV